MPSRRRLLAALGTATTGSLAGCGAVGDATSGTVTSERIHVDVPRRGRDPVEVAAAWLNFEPDRRLVHGEYDPELLDSAVQGGDLTVPESVHAQLTARFAAVRYSVNVVPDDGQPGNGVLSRTAFNRLSLGGTATVESFTGESGYGRLRVREATPREREPAEINLAEVDLETAVD